MSWHARLELSLRVDAGRCIAHSAHQGPLRVLKTLYPEGSAIAHQVIVHPPGGIVGGDQLDITLELQPHAHAVITTPGATRFYRSDGEPGVQRVQARLHDGARLEWLPLESIAHSGCIAENRAEFQLGETAEMIGWDVLALGLPAAGEAFVAGRFTQHVELPGLWLERGVIAGTDTRLLHSPLGLAGRGTLLTMWFASGRTIEPARLEALVDGARECMAALPERIQLTSGVTALRQQVIVLRALAHRVEPAMVLARALRARWRMLAWALESAAPRIWQT
jgi:urease accessory protein